jgi:uncharacterized membrane protein HdeD (DUF308 family)
MITITLLIMGIIAIILGLIVLIKPKVLNIAVAIWLLIWGILQLLNAFGVVITGFSIIG